MRINYGLITDRAESPTAPSNCCHELSDKSLAFSALCLQFPLKKKKNSVCAPLIATMGK